MVNEDFSCIKEVTKIVSLTLPSVYNTNEITGICDALESWKRQYVKQLQGIVVGYKNVALTSKRGYLKVDCPVIYCNVKATFELFYPMIGNIIKGKVNRVSQDYIGCLVHDTINVTVHRTDDISSDISQYIVLDHFILFQITRINFKSKVIQVKGKITEECVTLMKELGMHSDIDVCDNNMLTFSSPDFSGNTNNRKIYSDSFISNNNVEESSADFDLSTDTSSQTSTHKKKKKHTKSKENFSMSSSFTSESLEDNLSQIELTQSSDHTKKRKRKKSDASFASPDDVLKNQIEEMHPKKKIKAEKHITSDINTVELTQSSDGARKRKRKKSDVNVTSPTNALENELEPIHPKKKLKTEDQTSWINDTAEFIDNNSSFVSSDISNSEKIDSMRAATPDNCSQNVATDVLKFEVSTPVKKKKHKKSKGNSSPSFSHHAIKTESILSPITNSQETLPSSHNMSEENFLTSPDLFDESLSPVKSETKPLISKKKKKKKDSVSDKNKAHKKSKNKFKKGSKKDKKKNKVISTKKKIHGLNEKLKKKGKGKDKKSKALKKSKNKKAKKVPE